MFILLIIVSSLHVLVNVKYQDIYMRMFFLGLTITSLTPPPNWRKSYMYTRWFCKVKHFMIMRSLTQLFSHSVNQSRLLPFLFILEWNSTIGFVHFFIIILVLAFTRLYCKTPCAQMYPPSWNPSMSEKLSENLFGWSNRIGSNDSQLLSTYIYYNSK